MADARKRSPRVPRTEGSRTTLRVPRDLAAAGERLSRELGISRNDALLRMATRGARLDEEEQAIERVRAARWTAVIHGDVKLDADAFPASDEVRQAILASRDLI